MWFKKVKQQLKKTKMVRKQKVEVEEVPVGPTEKEVLLELYDNLNTRGIRSISDLENQINQAE